MNKLEAATILIVDDESRNVRLLEALLRPEGYLTRSAASGKEALASIEQQAPDLILLDIMMPEMTGYEVADVLKANLGTANIPIIMVTALTDRDARLAGLNAGAEEFLTKPIDRAELWIRVRNLLRLKEYGGFLVDHNRILDEQVKERTAQLDEAYRLLKPGGHLLVVEWRAELDAPGPPKQIRVSAEKVEAMFRAAGFKEFKSENWTEKHYYGVATK